MLKWAASSAIHEARLASMVGCWFQVEGAHPANAHSSPGPATGFAFAAVHALFVRATYSPTVLGVSSIPTWDDTWDDGLEKYEPSDVYEVAPSAVCRTISQTVEPP